MPDHASNFSPWMMQKKSSQASSVRVIIICIRMIVMSCNGSSSSWVGNGSVVSILNFHHAGRGLNPGYRKKDPPTSPSPFKNSAGHNDNIHSLLLVIHSQLLKSTVLLK